VIVERVSSGEENALFARRKRLLTRAHPSLVGFPS
jgi:hypothetical protein